MRITTSTSPSPAASIASIQLGRIRLGLRHREAAGRLRGAGHRVAPHERHRFGSRDAAGVEDRLERGAIRHVAQQQVLLRREPHAETLTLDGAPHGSPQHRRAAARSRRRSRTSSCPPACACQPRWSCIGGSGAGAAFSSSSRKRDFSSARHRFDAEPADRVLPARLAAVLPLAVLLLEDRDRARRLDDLLAADAAEVQREQRRGARVVVRHARARRRCRNPRGCRRRRPPFATGTKPTSCVSTSTELSVGCAIPILNFRGR